MPDFNEIYLMLGEIRSSVKGVQEDVSEMKNDMRENVYPVMEDYKSWKNRLIGVCAVISAGVGAVGAYVGQAWKD